VVDRRTRRPFRGASRPAAASIPSRESKPDFHEHRTGIQRIHGGLSIGPSSVRPIPVLTPDVAVLGALGSFRSVATRYAFNVEGSPFMVSRGFAPDPHPRLRSGSSSSAPRSTSASKLRTPSRSAHAPLLGFDTPLQRIQRRAPVSPGDSNLRHIPSLGILTPSTSCFALRLAGLVSSRPTLLGFTRPPPPRSGLVGRLETSGRHALAFFPVRRSFE